MAFPTKIDELLALGTHDKSSIKCKFVNTKKLISTDDLFLMGKLVRDFQWQLYNEILSEQDNINFLLIELNKRSRSRRPPISIRKLATAYPSAIPIVRFEKGSIITELTIAEAMFAVFGTFTSTMLLRLFGEALSRTPTYQKLVHLLSKPLFKKADTRLVEKTIETLRTKREWRRHRITFTKINENTFEIEIETSRDETII